MEVYEVKVVIDSPVMAKIDTIEHRLLANSIEDAINKIKEICKNEGFKAFTTLEIESAKLLSQEEQEKWFKINHEQREETI
jgi:hypothetical protein